MNEWQLSFGELGVYRHKCIKITFEIDKDVYYEKLSIKTCQCSYNNYVSWKSETEIKSFGSGSETSSSTRVVFASSL